LELTGESISLDSTVLYDDPYGFTLSHQFETYKLLLVFGT